MADTGSLTQDDLTRIRRRLVHPSHAAGARCACCSDLPFVLRELDRAVGVIDAFVKGEVHECRECGGRTVRRLWRRHRERLRAR